MTICVLQDKYSGRTIGHARQWNGLYYLEHPNLPPDLQNINAFFSDSITTNREKVFLHHCRLGHPSFRVIKLLFPSFFTKLDVASLNCEVCELAKHKCVLFPVSNNMSTSPFYLVHTDVWGPSTVPNVSSARWFLTFIDDCTCVTWVFLLKHKTEVIHVFQRFFSMVTNQFGITIKRIRSDNAKDYFNHDLISFCQKEGSIHESSCVKTPQQNGIAERKNRHLLDQTWALLFQHKVPTRFWGEAVLTGCYLINRLPSTILASKSPMEVLSSFYPNVPTSNQLVPRIFGCVSFVYVPSGDRGKLDPRALKCVFIGYSSTQKGYKCYHPPSKKFFVSKDDTFFEHKSYFHQDHLQGENAINEDGLLILPDLSFEPKVGTESVTTEKEPTKSTQDQADVRFGKKLVYTRKTKAIPEYVHVQQSNPTLFEVTTPTELTSDFPNTHAEEPEFSSTPLFEDLDIPIAIRKESRKCTTKPLYPLVNYLSFKHFSPTHKAFLTSINTTTTPTTLSEALDDKK